MAASSTVFKSQVDVNKISDSVTGLSKGIQRSQKTVGVLNKTLISKNKFKKESLFRDKELFFRRRDAIRRREQESIIEAARFNSSELVPQIPVASAISGSNKGFLGRMLDFAGSIFVGWLLNNLPTIIKSVKIFTVRVVNLTRILGSFVLDIRDILNGLGGSLNAVLYKVSGISFSEEHENIQTEFNNLLQAVTNLGTHFDDAINLFKTPLGQGPGEQPDQTPTSPSPTNAPSGPSTESRMTGPMKQALDIIARPESGGDYNAMNQGQSGDRPGGSRKWLGKDLTDMTIGEVLQRQSYEEDRRNPRLNNYGIWAAGRYQIIPSTMRDAVKRTGLKSSDMFSPGNQDKLGLAVLKSQGIGAWRSSYTAQEKAIVAQAQRSPISYTEPSTGPQQSNISITRQGGLKQYITGDHTDKAHYQQDHDSGYYGRGGSFVENYHDHLAFTNRALAIKAFNFFKERGFEPYQFLGYDHDAEYLRLHHWGPDHPAGLAFDIPGSHWKGKPGTPSGPTEWRGSAQVREALNQFLGQSTGVSSQKSSESQSKTSTSSSPQAAQLEPADQEYTGPLTREQAYAMAEMSAPPSNLPSQIQSITPERRGDTVVVPAPQDTSQVPQVSLPQSSSIGLLSVPEEIVLNRFISTRFLLDLAYT